MDGVRELVGCSDSVNVTEEVMVGDLEKDSVSEYDSVLVISLVGDFVSDTVFSALNVSDLLRSFDADPSETE